MSRADGLAALCRGIAPCLSVSVRKGFLLQFEIYFFFMFALSRCSATLLKHICLDLIFSIIFSYPRVLSCVSSKPVCSFCEHPTTSAGLINHHFDLFVSRWTLLCVLMGPLCSCLISEFRPNDCVCWVFNILISILLKIESESQNYFESRSTRVRAPNFHFK